MNRQTLGVLISGRGSNLQALIEACAAEDYPARIGLVISNNPGAAGLDRAREAGIKTRVIDHRAHEDRAAFDAALNEALSEHRVDLICLAGFMRLLGADFCNLWRNRVINIHPSLLPAFKGLHVHERVLEAGVRITGCTVHILRPEMDSGPVLVQAAVPVCTGDDAATLAGRVLEAEHRIYPLAVRLIAEGRVRISGDRAEITGATETPPPLIYPGPDMPAT